MSIRLIYTSKAHESCDQIAIDNILLTSQQLNSENEVTGILYFSNQFFMQYLEGEKNLVEATYERIAKDRRHTDLKLVHSNRIETRNFKGWSMAFVPQSERLTSLNEKYLNSSVFNPADISSDTALKMVLELRNELPKAHYILGHA